MPKTIIKANGERVDYDGSKLISAMINAGASLKEAEAVESYIFNRINDGMKTSKIYRMAYDRLKIISDYIAGRYRLKKAVFELGPSGYPFEKFVGKLLEFRGYDVSVNVIGQGNCVQHELDVVAENKEERIMVECKFHRDKGHKNDVKIPLYIHSRFLDMEKAWKKDPQFCKKPIAMIASNTRFSGDAIQYASCVGMRLLSWDYPIGNSLKDWIDESGFHPISVLRTLNRRQTQGLLNAGIVLCRDLNGHEDIMEKVGVPRGKINSVLKEANVIVAKNRLP